MMIRMQKGEKMRCFRFLGGAVFSLVSYYSKNYAL